MPRSNFGSGYSAKPKFNPPPLFGQKLASLSTSPLFLYQGFKLDPPNQ